MKRENFQDRMKKEQEELREKEKTIALAKKAYARFGNKVLTYMINYATSESGMIRLFKILNLPMTDLHKEEDQHAALVDWLNKYGERRFLELHRVDQTDKDLDTSFLIEPVIMDDVQKPLYAPVDSVERGQGAKPVDMNRAPEAQTQKPESRPIPLTPPIRTPLPPDELVRSAESAWDGKERRSGKDRRQSPDRRNDVEIIYKNKRYGGERRKIKDRRKN